MVSHQIRPVNHFIVRIPLNCRPIQLHSRDPYSQSSYSMMVSQEMSQVKLVWPFIVFKHLPELTWAEMTKIQNVLKLKGCVCLTAPGTWRAIRLGTINGAINSEYIRLNPSCDLLITSAYAGVRRNLTKARHRGCLFCLNTVRINTFKYKYSAYFCEKVFNFI